MQGPRDTATPLAATVAARHAAWLDACWPQVRVESVQVGRYPAGQSASALVQLGGLTPADVRVELISAEPADEASSTREERRMCSSHAFGNGCVVFDATLPPHDTARPHEWLIHVHPSEGLEEPRVEYRFRTGDAPSTTPAPKPAP